MTFVDANEVHVNVDSDVSEPVAVEVNEFRGIAKLDVRHWYTRKDGALARTRKGVSVPVEDSRRLIEALIEAHNLAHPDQVLSLVE